MPVTPHPDCPAVVHGPAPYGRCICATRPAPTARGADRRAAAPRRVHEATLHYARENLLAVVLAGWDALDEDDIADPDLGAAIVAYRAAESADLGPE